MIRTTINFLLAIAISVWISTPVWAGYEEGKAAFDKGDYESALEQFEPLAESENANAQYYLGILYRNGWAVDPDDHEAARWLRLAAFQDHVEAQYSLGYMYEHGQGVTQDMTEAKRWYRMAANQGSTDAQHNLEIIYYEENNAPRARSGDQGDLIMNSNSGDFFDTILGALIGLNESMTVTDVVVISVIILIILVPVIMPFSFYRKNP
jgi:TPR repeat protein